MAARLFSKDPLSWGQILFLWVGGLSVVGVLVIAAVGMFDEGDAALSSADRLEARAERLAEGLPEFVSSTPKLGPIPGVTDRAEAETNIFTTELEVVLERERRRLADSASVFRRWEGQSERNRARRWFGGALALLLLAAGGLAFLVWRSFHGAGRSESH